ncbi:MAG: DNA polymerase III subunit chi [Sedimenticola sp.]|uniref:DNA polymerase III subunit chi n=1 Tax=Sedimenticola thiotaurini TaxID=1543721 RepID=A0A558CV48_9GAMM|nr:DNA polymerase III subunit chi [Sedimenticola sp.]TVT52651.1 MAG: DNA polymerase III subunit chi [Sedimenticola thiotaurini]MCW8882731.1 DNA polymerase III subunit chi [Sedimenticola sp.]MCW8974196.1 DNA polymerase III subunit chi [Sedimenticola sp.]MCW9021537.1 DNA polymerase III subunit chi [Sedimenticola sp.]
MTQVDFYILGEQAQGDRFQLACRIADKAWQQGHRIYLHTNSDSESRHMDKLLWTHREESFIPHGLLGESESTLTPILIGHAEQAGEEHDVLINLATTVPPFFSRFTRVAELIDKDPALRHQGRARYKTYRDRGYTLNTHTIDR